MGPFTNTQNFFVLTHNTYQLHLYLIYIYHFDSKRGEGGAGKSSQE